MNAKSYLKTPRQTRFASMGLLVLRVVVGLAFMHHGWSKIQHPFGWMGPAAGTPGFFQALAALSEFGGGLAWIIGLLVPLASLGVLSTMVVALNYHILVKGDPFVGQPSSYEVALVYLSVALLLFSAGPGKFSLDRQLFGEK